MKVHLPNRRSSIGVVVLHDLFHGIAEPIGQGWSTSSDRHGFVAIYPSRGVDWNAGLCCGVAAHAQRDDVTWLTTIITRAELKYSLRTMYLAGSSNGGMMVERLVAEHPKLATRFAVWGAAPEMPVAGHWTGYGYLFHGAADTTVPTQGGEEQVGNVKLHIRPAGMTSDWLKGAQLRTIIVAGRGHTPPPDWPEIAWSAMTSR